MAIQFPKETNACPGYGIWRKQHEKCFWKLHFICCTGIRFRSSLHLLWSSQGLTALLLNGQGCSEPGSEACVNWAFHTRKRNRKLTRLLGRKHLKMCANEKENPLWMFDGKRIWSAYPSKLPSLQDWIRCLCFNTGLETSCFTDRRNLQ